MSRLILIASLLVSTTARAEPVTSENYRYQSLAIDAAGLGLVGVAVVIHEANDGDTTASEALVALGGVALLAGVPLLHRHRGHHDRFAKSLALRGGLAFAGMLGTIAFTPSCDDDEEDVPVGFMCRLDNVAYGLLGGFVVASIIDAAVMTDETPSWSPQLGATDGGMRVGAAFTW